MQFGGLLWITGLSATLDRFLMKFGCVLGQLVAKLFNNLSSCCDVVHEIRLWFFDFRFEGVGHAITKTRRPKRWPVIS